MKVGSRINVDKVGAFASAACAVHCLLSGLALGLLSVLGMGFIGSTTTDIVFLSITLSVASIAIFTGVRRHRSWRPAALFMTGVVAIIISHFVLDHDSKYLPTRILTTTLAVMGGVFLVLFHVLNLRLQKNCQH